MSHRVAVPLLSAGSYGGGSFEPLRVGTHGALGTASGGGRGGGGEAGLLVLPLLVGTVLQRDQAYAWKSSPGGGA